MIKPFWDFWQISGWYAKWSKYHLFTEEGKNPYTLCDKQALPDNFQNTGEMPALEDRCKTCQKIYEKRLENGKSAISQ